MSIPLPLPPPDYYYNFSNSGNLGRDEAKKREKKTGEKCEKGKALPFGAGREKAEGKSILWFSSGGRRGEAGLRRGKPGPGSPQPASLLLSSFFCSRKINLRTAPSFCPLANLLAIQPRRALVSILCPREGRSSLH